MLGETINNYLLERKLGDGGMGIVYHALHNRVDREVAIKVLHNNLFINEKIRNRFKNEANALIKLNHPNIVKIFDYVEQENFACLIMEYINGYTLDEYIAKISGPLPSAKATTIICAVLDAVQYAHDNKIFHRDIKPSNIMISKDGNTVRIMDFGIAKLTDSSNFKTTHANAQLGTPFYMSPEQVKGLPYTALSDTYSLGVTLYEMVTGKCPYNEITNLFELQSKIVNEPLPPTSKYYPYVSQLIQNAITIATHKIPEQRFQSCNEFKKYLLEEETKPVVVPPKAKPASPPPVPLMERERKKSNSEYYLIGAIVLAIIIVASVFVNDVGEKEKSIKNTTESDTVEVASTFVDTSPIGSLSIDTTIKQSADTSSFTTTEAISDDNDKEKQSEKRSKRKPTYSDVADYLNGKILRPCGIPFFSSRKHESFNAKFTDGHIEFQFDDDSGNTWRVKVEYEYNESTGKFGFHNEQCTTK